MADETLASQWSRGQPRPALAQSNLIWKHNATLYVQYGSPIQVLKLFVCYMLCYSPCNSLAPI